MLVDCILIEFSSLKYLSVFGTLNSVFEYVVRSIH